MVLKRKLKKIVNSISIFLIIGCSYYSMAGSIPANINNVYIPLIENDTAEFEISENLTSKITQEIAIQNILKIQYIILKIKLWPHRSKLLCIIFLVNKKEIRNELLRLIWKLE